MLEPVSGDEQNLDIEIRRDLDGRLGPARLISTTWVPICSPLRTIANRIVSADACVAMPSKRTPKAPVNIFMRDSPGAWPAVLRLLFA